MWAWLTKPIDRLAMRSAMPSVRPSPDGNPHLQEAVQMLRRHDFFAPDVAPAGVALEPGDRFTFPSPRPSGCAESDRVPGRFFPAGEDWRTRPAVILIHGWNAELQYEWMLPFWGQLLARAGVNGFAFELPYHGARKPRSRDSIRNFFSGDIAHVMSATHQAIAETRALTRWLLESGAPSVGVWGVSLGGWLAGLAIANHPELSRAVMLTPVVRMDRAFAELPFCAEMRRGLTELDTAAFARLNVVSHQPLCPEHGVLIVSSKHDLFAPASTIDELEHNWRAEVWRLNHGHITVLLSTRVMRRIATWMARQLVAPSLPHK